jgi:hypothetical protein
MNRSSVEIEDRIFDSTVVEEPAIYGEAVQPAYAPRSTVREYLVE